MSHEWKVGDWCERDGIRLIVTKVNPGRIWAVGEDPGMCRFESTLTESFIPLPGCTGWDWQPPEPIAPPGYRLIVELQTVIKYGDKFLDDRGQWSNTGLSNMTVKELVATWY